ncbi:MAG: 30S ribosomal protein S5 [Nanoarchaeota archaeon]|nr:30S ribosomal protein S5 [Nanoarchaeota archaeon]
MIKEKKIEEVPKGVKKEKEFEKELWKPKTNLGKKVKNGEIKDINEIFDEGLKIMECQIVDLLLPDLEISLLSVGQSKGKFGGGKKSIWKQTQKKTKEGNKPKFATLAIVGNKNGYIGMGYGKSKETMPAKEKAIRKAKLNLIRIIRGCGSWTCNCQNPHSIPFKVKGNCSSTIIELIPAPKGTKLCIETECQQILNLAGIKDIYSKTKNTKTKLNLVKSCFNALKELSNIKIKEDYIKKAGIKIGKIT